MVHTNMYATIYTYVKINTCQLIKVLHILELIAQVLDTIGLDIMELDILRTT